jgi:ribonucleoside-diphosphate reductase alpha chain
MTGFERYGVAPETLLLTSKGQEKISTLNGKEVDVWNGHEFETVSVFKVADDKRIIRVTTDNGAELACSDDHIFYVQPGYTTDLIVPTAASDLEEGLRLMKASSFPTSCSGGEDSFPYAYSHGFYMGNERYLRKNGSLSRASIYGVRHPILEVLSLESQDKTSLYFPKDFPAMWELPLDSNYSLETKLEWLAGLFDGGLLKRKLAPKPIWHLYSNSKDFLSQVKLLIQTLGGDTRVVENEDLKQLPNSLRVSGQSVQNLIKLNIPTKIHKFPVIQYKRRGLTSPKIVTVEDDYRISPVYNFLETKGRGAIFNGLYTSSN